MLAAGGDARQHLLLDALLDDDPDIRGYALAILADLDRPPPGDVVVAALGGDGGPTTAAGRLVTAAPSPETVRRLGLEELVVSAVESKDGEVRELGVLLVGLLRLRLGVPALLALLEGSDGDEGTKVHAAEALGRIGDERAVPPLVDLTEKGTGRTRRRARRVLARIEDRRT